jgi:hypothetical protein
MQISLLNKNHMSGVTLKFVGAGKGAKWDK